MADDVIFYIKIGGAVSAIGILGFLVKLFIENLVTKSRTKQERLQKHFDDAAKNFRASFTEDIVEVESGARDTFDILKSSFEKHKAAMLEVKIFLKGRKLKSFERAWQEYCCHEKYPNQPFLEQYSAKGQSLDMGKKRRQLALERIERLLTFAEPK